MGESVTSHNPDEYLSSVKEQGFVPATKQAMAQVMTNTATLEDVTEQLAAMRADLDKVIGVLSNRLDKLERGKP